MINPFGFLITVIFYKLAKLCIKIPVIGKLPPIVIAGIGVIAVLAGFNIDFEYYNESASFLTLLLIPATIALGYPIFKQKKLLMKNKRIIFTAFFVACILGLSTTYLTAKLCHTDLKIIESMLPKSVTAPIAIEISKTIGGIPELTACIVVLTGVFGAMTGHKILEWVKVKSDVAIGLAIGAASHVIGTARCAEKGKEKQMVMASVAFIIVGIITALLAPIFVNLLLK